MQKSILPADRNFRVPLICGASLAAMLILFAFIPGWEEAPFYGLLGVVGAVFANSTGAGGGVVFIPTFSMLEFSEAQAVGTSFGIQCFGMTAGSIAWLLFVNRLRDYLPQWHSFPVAVLMTACGSVAGIWVANLGVVQAPATLKTLFSLFSMVLGAILLFLAIFRRHPGHTVQLLPIDYLALGIVGLLGGLVTAWMSVGVGEFLALYLLLRGFDAGMAVAAAVCVSAISVWSAIPYHLAYGEVELFIVLVAGPCAVVGGFLARWLVSQLSPRRLKIFFSLWVLLTGLATAPFF